MADIGFQDILDFWFSPEVVPVQFAEDPELDEKIRSRFLTTWEEGKDGLLAPWRKDIRGRVAEIIVLDQFSRNLWRSDRRSLSQDGMAVVLAQETVNHPDYDSLTLDEKKFVLLPFMHSESLAIHEQAAPYFEALNSEDTLRFEQMHIDVLKRFGRYPYQNADLGRESTPEEIEFLKETAGDTYGGKAKKEKQA